MELIREYSSRASAMRKAKQIGLKDPVIKNLDDGRVALYRDKVASAPVSSTEKPVQRFRELFSKHYGEKSWSEMIELAKENGIAENTAKTYYYKLKRELEENGQAA